MSLVCEGWEISFYKRFAQQRNDLRKKVRKLKAELPEEDYITHSDVKLLAAIMIGIKEKIVLDPFASHFALKGPLRKFGRLKKMGLSDRYRLFFKASEEGDRKFLVILWLGYPRKEGAKDDCYAVFEKMVLSGEFPDAMEDLLKLTES